MRSVREHFAAVRRRPRRDGRRGTSSRRRSCAGSTTTRARPGSSSGRWRTRTRPSPAAAATTTWSRRSAARRRRASASAPAIERLLLAIEDEGVAERRRAPAIDVFVVVEPDAPRELVAPLLAATARPRDRSRHGLRRPLAQGPADPGGPLRRATTTVILRPTTRSIRQAGRAGRTGRPRRCSRQTGAMTWRTHMCGEPDQELVGKTLTLSGWVGALPRPRRPRLRRSARPQRDHAARDQSRTRARGGRRSRTRSATSSSSGPRARSWREATRPSTRPCRRARWSCRWTTLEIVSRSTPLPFQLDEDNVDETLRLRYRWLDLRREKLQRNISLRAQMVGIIRREMEAAGFLDIQTPILFKPTPEGARDFVVPSRLQKGRFYALPQSPQILKQLTMVAGFDRYYQIAICFRDEDLRADRVQEITQLDVEMSFPDQELLYDVMERMYARIWRECLGVEIATPFPRHDVRGGRPPLRQRQAGHPLRAGARGRDRGRRAAPGSASSPAPRPCGSCACHRSSAAATWRSSRRLRRSGARRGSRTSSSTRRARCARRSRSSSPSRSSSAFRGEPASTVLFAADTWATTSRVLGALRLHLGRELGLIDEEMLHVPLGLRLPHVRAGRGGRPLDRGPPPVHAAEQGVGGALRRAIPGTRSRTPTT